MKKIKISQEYIRCLWSELYHLPDEIYGLNLNNISSINKLINDYLIHKIKLRSVSWAYRFKGSLKYAVNFWDDVELESLYNGSMPAIPLPSTIPVREFYIHVWNALYPDESYKIENPSDYILLDNSATNSFRW